MWKVVTYSLAVLLLLQSPEPSDPGGGYVRLIETPAGSAIMVFVRRLEPGNVYDVVMSRNGDSEVIGMITTQAGNASGVDRNDESADGPGGGDDGAVGSRSGHLRIDTRRGDSLPLGAESVVDLVGTTVSVNNPDGTVDLSGDNRRPEYGRWMC